jgi:aminopeptidase
MLRLQLGDDAFFELLRTWTSQNRHGSVTTDGFVSLAAEFGTASEVLELFRRWLDQAALPALPRSTRRRR